MAKTTRSRFRLTKSRQEWLDARKDATLVGPTLGPNVALEKRYERELAKEVSDMRRVVEREMAALFPAYATDAAMDAADGPTVGATRILTNELIRRFAAHFSAIAPKLAERMMRRADAGSRTVVGSAIRNLSGGLSLKTPALTGPALEAYKASVGANVSLIKSIPSGYLERVQDAAFRALQTGGRGRAELLDEVNRLGQTTERRAKLIARDQVSKATASLNHARFEKLGVRKFRWIHSGGGKEPRPLHVQYNGQVFSLDDPPIIDEKTKERGLPGQLINCRCRMAPVVDFGSLGK